MKGGYRVTLGSAVLGLVLLLATTLLPAAEDFNASVPAAGILSATSSVAETFEGLSVGFTDDGHPYRGAADAPVTLEEFSDYLCPFCARHFTQTLPTLLNEYVVSGQVRYVFRDMPLASLHPTASKGSVAALCMAEQGAAEFWKMHDALFETQQQWSQLPDPGDYLASVAEILGANMSSYRECMQSGRQEPRVEESIAIGQKLGFNGTPSFQFARAQSEETYTLIGAHPMERFNLWLDALLAGEAPPVPEEAKPAELPLWARPEGLAPDTASPGYTLAGDQYKGNPEAALVVVEFTDFQCPPCQRHALETQPELDRQFVDNGEVLWVFKHLPLKEHPQSAAAATAAECAAEQGKFWEMHHLLFEQQGRWAGAAVDTELIALAAELQLDEATFTTCFNGRKALEQVLRDIYDAQGVVQTTPTFITIYGGKGGVLRGSLPAEKFVVRLQTILADAKTLGVANAKD